MSQSNTATADHAAAVPSDSVKVSLTFPPSTIAWLYQAGFLPPHVAPSPRAVGEAVATMIRSVRGSGLRLAPPPAPEPPPLPAEALPPPATEGLLADEDAPVAPPAAPLNGETFDTEAEARAAYFKKMATVQS